MVHCGGSIRCIKAEIGDEAREKGEGLHLELVPWKNRVLKDFKKGKEDPIYVLERLLWCLVEGGWKGQTRGEETSEAVAVTQRGSVIARVWPWVVGSDQRLSD